MNCIYYSSLSRNVLKQIMYIFLIVTTKVIVNAFGRRLLWDFFSMEDVSFRFALLYFKTTESPLSAEPSWHSSYLQETRSYFDVRGIFFQEQFRSSGHLLPGT